MMVLAAWLGLACLVVPSPASSEPPASEPVSITVSHFTDGVRRDSAAECGLKMVTEGGLLRPLAADGAVIQYARTGTSAFAILDCGGRRLIEPTQENLLHIGGVVLFATWSDLPKFEAEVAEATAGEDFAGISYRGALQSAQDAWRKLPKAVRVHVHRVHVYSQVVGWPQGKQISATRTWWE